MFKVNDIVVYPGHGVAVIQDKIEKVVENQKTCFFKLCFKFKDMTILIPECRLNHTGIRLLSDMQLINKALNELNEQPTVSKQIRDQMPAGWSKRQKEFQARLESGNLCDIASTYRDLKRYAEKKQLSFGERGLLQTAEDLLIQEIVSATMEKRDEVMKRIRSPFEKSALCC